MSSSPRPAFGLNAPSPAMAAAASAAAVLAIAAQPAALAQVALFASAPQTPLDGAWTLIVAAAQSAFKVGIALLAALGLVSLLLAATLRRPRAGQAARHSLAVLANAPVLMLLPIWLVTLGNSEAAGLAFLIYCMATMLGFTVFDDATGGARLARRMVESFPLDGGRRIALVIEVVISTMRQSIFQILVLGLPLALAAELITNQSGLGYIATNAFSNGDFVQLALVAAAYVLAFCLLWLAWALALSAPLRTLRPRSNKERPR